MSLKTRRFQQRSSRFTQNTRIRATAGFGMIWKRIMAFWPATSWSLTLLTRQFRKIQMHILCSTVTAGTSTPAESSTRNCWTLVWRQVCLAWDAALTMARWKASGVSSNENVTMDIHLAGKVSFRRLRTTLTITTIAATSTACSSKHQCRLMSVPWTGGPDNDLHKKSPFPYENGEKNLVLFFLSTWRSAPHSITETKGLDSLLGYLIPQGKSYFLGFLMAAWAGAKIAERSE